MDKTILKQAALNHPAEIMQPFATLQEMMGLDATLVFIEQLSGMMVYVPNMRTIFAGCLEQEARREFNGSNFTALAKKYGYTERHIRRMLAARSL